MVKLFLGDGIAKVIGIATMPFITRIYSPEDIGVLSIYTALIAILIPFGTLRYSVAIPLLRNDAIAINLVALCFSILLFTTAIVILALVIFHLELFTFFSVEKIDEFWWLIPIGFFGAGLFEILSSWGLRSKAFSALAKTSVVQKISGASTKILLGLLGFKPLGLLIGHVFTQTGGLYILGKYIKKTLKENVPFIRFKRAIFLSKRFFHFPKFRVPSQFLLSLTAKAPLFFFAWYYGTELTGQIGLALIMLSFPITLIGYTTGKAYYAEIAELGKQSASKILSITKGIIKKLIIISVIPFTIIIFFGPWLFEIVFGQEWTEAGNFASILAIYLIAQFIYSPISDGIFNVFEKQSKLLLLELSRFFITATVLSFGFYLQWDPTQLILFYSFCLTFHYIFSTYILIRIIKTHDIN